jgi:prevent-host-death family protein
MLIEPCRVDEPRGVQEYSDVLTRVATEGRPLIVRRNGADLAAVIPMGQLEMLQEMLAWQEAEKRAAQLRWQETVKAHPPPQAWFDDDDNPFEPEEGAAP